MPEDKEYREPLFGYMRLAAEIVRSGRAANDERFLQSDWCKFLTETVCDYCNERLSRSSGVSVVVD